MLVDNFGRRIEYVRLSVTDKCNMRCFYCLPQGHRDFELPESWLTFDEIERVMRTFADLGVSKCRITGGEPLVRKGIAELASRLHALSGIDDLSISTNAALLSQQAEALAASGISRVNVSLDTLQADRFRDITGSDIEPVIQGLKAASRAGLSPVKINMVAMRGINDDEINAMVEFCMHQGFTLRLIETMPMGDTGREGSKHYLDLQPVRARLQQRYDLVDGIMPGGGPARYMQTRDGGFRIGFITPISRHFCETCNRVRLSVDGTLYMCLGQDSSVDLRSHLRAGIDDAGLRELIITAIDLKPEKHEFNLKPQQLVRFMNVTGG